MNVNTNGGGDPYGMDYFERQEILRTRKYTPERRTLDDKVNEFISTLDTLSYVHETPRGFVVGGTKAGTFVVREIKDHL
jgi:hypothetical protein